MKVPVLILAVLVISASCGKSPQERARSLAGAALGMVRLEQQALLDSLPLEGARAAADSQFLAALKSGPGCVSEFVATGSGSCAGRLEAFLRAARASGAPGRQDDPASVVLKLLSEPSRKAPRNPELLDGYAAAFQMCLEVDRDGTVLQDLLPFLVALGCPMTYRDLGLDSAGRSSLLAFAAEASGRTGKMPYDTSPGSFFMTLVKLDSWGSKFSGQVTGDTLAAHLLGTPECAGLADSLRRLPPLRLGFLGDSHMDKIHWSTQAPFPEIVAAVFRLVNPGVTVINAGKGGDDSGEALARMDTALTAKNPELSFVMLGGNDSRHYGRPNPAVTPEQYVKNISEIVSRLRATGGRVVLMAPPGSPELKGEDRETFLAINRNLVALKDSLKTGWIDVGGLVAQGDTAGVFAVDGIHMSPRGHLRVAESILEYIAREK